MAQSSKGRLIQVGFSEPIQSKLAWSEIDPVVSKTYGFLGPILAFSGVEIPFALPRMVGKAIKAEPAQKVQGKKPTHGQP